MRGRGQKSFYKPVSTASISIPGKIISAGLPPTKVKSFFYFYFIIPQTYLVRGFHLLEKHNQCCNTCIYRCLHIHQLTLAPLGKIIYTSLPLPLCLLSTTNLPRKEIQPPGETQRKLVYLQMYPYSSTVPRTTR